MVTLLQSNPYLLVKAAVRRNIRYNAQQSCSFKGVRVSSQAEHTREIIPQQKACAKASFLAVRSQNTHGENEQRDATDA